IGFKYQKSAVVVQALKSLGKEHISEQTIRAIRAQLDDKERRQLLKDTKSVTSWIYSAIKEICAEEV
ncbi:hypothetical protein KAI87_16915, partial [Myxococcota bacterium]|nr:hypothetical protein [Myxococcota bacterium]